MFFGIGNCRVQILDDAGCISLYANAIRKGMSLSAMSIQSTGALKYIDCTFAVG